MIATVVGSYPRVGTGLKAPSIRAAISRLDRGEITEGRLSSIQDQVTAEAIDEQVDAGLDLVTDGQIRWDDSQTYFASRLDGLEIGGLVRYFDTNTYYRQPVATGKVAWQRPITVADFRFASAHSSRPVKTVVTGPYTLASLSQQGTYESLGDFVMDLAAALNLEARALDEAGAEIIQFDEPAIVGHGVDPVLLHDAMLCLTEGVRAKKALYTYFGDFPGTANGIFDLPFQVFGLDFVAGPRSCDLVRDLPGDRELGMGILDARNTRLETLDEVQQAVERVSRWVDPERIHLGPSAGLEFLPRDRARAKVRRVAEAAASA